MFGFDGLIGALIAIAILCILVYIIWLILTRVAGVPIPPVALTIVWCVVGIICLMLLARGLGIAVPGN